MKDKTDNLVSKYIFNNCVWNSFHWYFPEISKGENGWGVQARLPKDIYKKWIARIVGNELFRKRIVEKIEEVISSQAYRHQTFLRIIWKSFGPAFETDGQNFCATYVPYNVGDGFECHNIDSCEQAHLLFLCLSIFLPNLYIAMEMLESGKYKKEDWPEFKEEYLLEEIKLRRLGK